MTEQMTERIEKLVEQAIAENESDWPEFRKSLTGSGALHLHVFAEAFAESIVRECIRCCEQVISDPVPRSVDTWYSGGMQCIDEIKIHFGIKE